MSARSTALGALIACRKTNAWSDGVLKEAVRRDRLDSRDAALRSHKAKLAALAEAESPLRAAAIASNSGK